RHSVRVDAWDCRPGRGSRLSPWRRAGLLVADNSVWCPSGEGAFLGKLRAQSSESPRMSSLEQALRAALETREPLLAQLHEQATDCYRLFHGSQEGAPG